MNSGIDKIVKDLLTPLVQETVVDEYNRLRNENAALLAQNKLLVEALSHPDIAELDYDCGYFEGDKNETIEHRCIKHWAENVLSKVKGEG